MDHIRDSPGTLVSCSIYLRKYAGCTLICVTAWLTATDMISPVFSPLDLAPAALIMHAPAAGTFQPITCLLYKPGILGFRRQYAQSNIHSILVGSHVVDRLRWLLLKVPRSSAWNVLRVRYCNSVGSGGGMCVALMRPACYGGGEWVPGRRALCFVWDLNKFGGRAGSVLVLVGWLFLGSFRLIVQ